MPGKTGESADPGTRIRAVLAKTLSLPPERIVPGASLMADLECDSMAFMDVLEALEGEFGLEIPTSAVEEIDTVADLERYLRRRGVAGPGAP